MRAWSKVALAVSAVGLLAAYVNRPSSRPRVWLSTEGTLVDSAFPEFLERVGTSRLVGPRWLWRVGNLELALTTREPGLPQARGTTYLVEPPSGLDVFRALRLLDEQEV